MASLSEAKMRHTLHYISVARFAETTYLQGKPSEGLALFDRERHQLDVVWAWLLDQDKDKSDIDTDNLILQLGRAPSK